MEKTPDRSWKKRSGVFLYGMNAIFAGGGGFYGQAVVEDIARLQGDPPGHVGGEFHRQADLSALPDPGGGDFTRRGEMEAAGAVQLRHKGGANVRFQQAAAVGIEPDARQRLNEPAADVPPEMVVVGGDVAPLGLEILPQAGGARGPPSYRKRGNRAGRSY